MFRYPDFLNNITEIKSLYNVCDEEDTKMQGDYQKVYRARRIDTMSEEDIARLLQSVNISGVNRFGVDGRNKILKLHFEMIPNYTETKIRRFFDNLIGKDMYEIDVDEKNLVATIQISMRLYESDAAIRKIFDEIIPLNYQLNFRCFLNQEIQADIRYSSYMIVDKKVHLEVVME